MDDTEKTPNENAPATPPPVAEETATISADNLASEIAGSMPAITPGENETKSDETFPRQDGDSFWDKSGAKFDPEIHRANPLTGVPEINDEGNFKSKRGRKGKVEAYRPSTLPDGTAIAPDEFDHNATLFLGMFFSLACAHISPAWKPGGLPSKELTPEQQKKEADAENESLRFPLAAYLREKKFKELKPWQMLTLAAATFGFRRYSEDEITKKKFDAIGAGVRAKIFGKKTTLQ